MFRLKFIVGLFVLFAIQVLVVLTALNGTVQPMVMEDTDIALQRSAALVEKSHRIDEFSLAAKARFVAERPNMRRGMVAEYEGDAEFERHVEIHKFLETELLRFQQQARHHEGTRNLDLNLRNRRPAEQEIFMALDDTGRGVATMGRDLAHWMGDKVAHDFPIVLDSMEENDIKIDMWNWAWRASDDRQLYSVAIAPIRHPDREESTGVVVLGNLINDGVAERSRALISDGLGSDGTQDRSQRQEVLSPDVAYFRGDRIYSSTLRSSRQSELREQLFDVHDIINGSETPEKILDLEIEGRPYRAIVRFFSGQFESNNPAGVVLLTNRDNIVAPIERSQTNILFVSGILFFLGLILIMVFFHLFLRPLATLEDGVQTIISGDKDHVFDDSGSNPVANGLAHHFNLLSAYLQGKPMPDDDVTGGGWEPLPGSETESKDESADEKPAVSGVPLGMGMGKKPKKSAGDEESETATEEKV